MTVGASARIGVTTISAGGLPAAIGASAFVLCEQEEQNQQGKENSWENARNQLLPFRFIETKKKIETIAAVEDKLAAADRLVVGNTILAEDLSVVDIPGRCLGIDFHMDIHIDFEVDIGMDFDIRADSDMDQKLMDQKKVVVGHQEEEEEEEGV